MKKSIPVILAVSALLTLAGCSSALTHSGSNDHQYYPGTQASYAMLTAQDSSWTLKPFIALDMPFTIVLDTLLLPWDAMKNKTSIKSKIDADQPQQ